MAEKTSKDLKKKIQGYGNAMNAAEYEAALDQYYVNKQNDENIAELRDKSALKQWEENEKIRQLKISSATDQFDKSQETYDTTLEAIDLSARDAEDRVKLGLDEQIAEFAFQSDDLERDMLKATNEAGLQYDQKEQSLEAARITDMTSKENYKIERNLKTAEYKYQEDENRLDKSNARQDIKQNKLQIKSSDEDTIQNEYATKNIGEDIEQNKISKKQNLTGYRDNQIQLTLQNIQARGAARAKGQQGNSVQRAVKTSVALEGINQQTLSDNLYYSQSSLDSQRRQLDNNKSSSESKGKQIGHNKTSLSSKQKQLRNKKESVKNNKKLIKANKKADLGTGNFKISKSGDYSAKDARKAGGRLGLNLSTSKKKSVIEKKGIKKEQDYISESLGITAAEFDMSREKLAESLQSATANTELKLKNIKTKEFEAQGQAYSQKMVAPRFGDAQPVPFKTPRTEYAMPQPAPKTPMMNGSMGRGMNRPASGASTALGIGSAVLGVGAAIATGGTSTALTAGAGILGGLSKLFG